MRKTVFIKRSSDFGLYATTIKHLLKIDKTVLFKAFSCYPITVHPHESLKRKQGGGRIN